MAQTSVTRCAAVASHGRRCQQTPYGGSGYCWHHLRSQKLHRPSRPPVRRGPGRGPTAEPAVPAGVVASRTRLDRELGAERVRALLDFLEGDADGTFSLRRQNGVLGPAEIRRAPLRRAG